MSRAGVSAAIDGAFGVTSAVVPGVASAPADETASEDRPARLLHGSAREILARIVPGDALGLRGCIADRLDERHLVADADRLQLQLAIRVARRAAHGGARGDWRTWLLARLDPLLDELAAARELPASEAADGFARSLGLDPPRARRAIAALNACTPEQRRAFHGLLLARRELDELARVERVNASELGRRARAALDAVLAALGAEAGATARAAGAGGAA